MPSMSPRTQQLQAGAFAGNNPEDDAFAQGLSSMAYAALASRMADLISDVVTFKVLKTDIDVGTGVGVFVVLRQGQALYVPVVMVNNALKPLEVFYDKARDVFLPLTKGWLADMQKSTLGSLGQGMRTPKTLYNDVDIRNVVVPPLSGRFSYASWLPAVLDDMATLLTPEALEKVAAAPALKFPTLLGTCTNRTKKAYAAMFARHPRLLKHAAATYGVTALTDALRLTQEKRATAALPLLQFADHTTTAGALRQLFGTKVGEAFSSIKTQGYAAKDDRPRHNLVVREQAYQQWIEPEYPGSYVLFDNAAREHLGFVMPHPVDLFRHGAAYTRQPRQKSKRFSEGRAHAYLGEGSGDTKYLAVFPDGDYLCTTKLAGRKAAAGAFTDGLDVRIFKNATALPKPGKGFFVRRTGATYQATLPLRIKSVTTDTAGVRRITAERTDGYMEDYTLITDPAYTRNDIWMPAQAPIVYIPDDFLWLPLRERLPEASWFTSTLDLQHYVSNLLAAVGAKKVVVKNAGAAQYSINGKPSLDRVPALQKLAQGCAITVKTAQALLDEAHNSAQAAAWVVTLPQLAYAQQQLNKLAAEEAPQAGAPEDAPPEVAPPPLAPPPPAPLDLATLEMDQSIQQEMQKLVEKRQMLQQLQQRSNEIAGGAPIAAATQTQAMGAPPASQNLATGGPAAGSQIPPAMGGAAAPAMGPAGGNATMGGDPEQGSEPAMGGDPAMDPSMGGDPSMDPSMSGDPSMGATPPQGATMPVDGPNAQTLPAEINPTYLDQAAQLHAADMFDATAVSLLAQSPELHGVVTKYLPDLEKAVDNLARVLLTLWLQEPTLKPQIGDQAFVSMESSLQGTFKALGESVLRLSRGATAIAPTDTESYAR